MASGKHYSAFDKVFKPAFWFSLGFFLASVASTWILVHQLGRFAQGANPKHVVIMTWIAYITIAGIALLSFLVGSWIGQSKVLWLLPPLSRSVSFGLGVGMAALWFLVEALRPQGTKLPSWVSWIYFVMLPGFVAVAAELLKARFNKISPEGKATPTNALARSMNGD